MYHVLDRSVTEFITVVIPEQVSYHTSKDIPGTMRILSNGIRICIAAVYTKICVRTLGLYYFVFLEDLLVSYTCFTTRSLQYMPTGAVYRKRRMEANKKQQGKQTRTYQSPLYTPVACLLPCTYMSSGTRLKLDKQPRSMSNN